MKKGKEYWLNLFLIIAAPIEIVAGVLLVVIPDKNRIAALGFGLICVGAWLFFMWLIRVLAAHSVKKEKRLEEKKRELERAKKINEALSKFENAVDPIEPDTVRLIETGMEFYAVGRYVCEKDFKGIPGHHLAFEIMSTGLYFKPKDYDDVCDLGGSGILISVGYHDGEALEKYANDNGVILQDTPENLIGRTIQLSQDKGYSFNIWTVEGDDIDFGFVKILKCENDVLTVRFLLDVSFGLSDTVEGVVRLKKEASQDALDIQSLISGIKWKRYNTIEVSAETLSAIRQTAPFLPESYIEFLRQIGFADMDCIDVGFDNKTPTNLRDDEIEFVKDLLAAHKAYRLDDFYFIAIDNDGSYYAISRNPEDKKVYGFSHEAPHIFTYESFEKFLSEIINA